MRNAILIGLLLAIAAAFFATRAMMAPAPADVMVELTLAQPGVLTGRLLKKGPQDYVRTSQLVHMSYAAATRFVMGDRSSLRPGAIVEISRAAGQPAGVASRIVVLTDYVRVK
jgi:hypothetical protein